MAQSWTKQRVLDEIQALHKREGKLHSRYARKLPLYGAACYHFGSWRRAVQSAGFNYADVKQKGGSKLFWTRDKIKKKILELSQTPGRLSTIYICKHHAGLYTGAVKQFGGWKAAVTATDIDYDSVRAIKSWSKAKIASEIKRRYEAGQPINVAAVMQQDRGFFSAARHHFGSWAKALEFAGFKPREVDGRICWSAEKVIEEIKRINSLGLPLHFAGLSSSDRSSLYPAGQRYFGSWPQALEASGLNCEDIVLFWYKNYWSKERVLEKIKCLAESGMGLDRKSVSSKHGDLVAAAGELFGSWGKAIEIAGFDYEKVKLVRHGYWSKEKIIAEIQRLESEGVRLNFQNIRSRRPDLVSRAWALFGSWGQAVEIAGFNYFEHYAIWSTKAWLKQLTRDEVLRLEQVADDLSDLKRKNERRQ